MGIIRMCPKLRSLCITGTRIQPGGVTESGLRWLRRDPSAGRVLTRLWLGDVTKDEYRRFKAFRKLSKARSYLDILKWVTGKKAAETPGVAAEQPEVAAEPAITKEPKLSKLRHGVFLIPKGPAHLSREDWGVRVEHASSRDDDSSDTDDSSDGESSRDTNQVFESFPSPRRRDHLDVRLASWRAGGPASKRPFWRARRAAAATSPRCSAKANMNSGFAPRKATTPKTSTTWESGVDSRQATPVRIMSTGFLPSPGSRD